MGNAILVSGQLGCSLRVAAHSDFTCTYTCTENFNISAQELLIVITFFLFNPHSAGINLTSIEVRF